MAPHPLDALAHSLAERLHAQGKAQPIVWDLRRDQLDAATHGRLDRRQLDAVTDLVVDALDALAEGETL